MQSSRQTFIETLRREFEDADVKTKRIQSSLLKISQGEVTRMFDDYPSLSQDELITISQNFKTIFAKIEKIDTAGDKIQLADMIDKTALTDWEKNIAVIACDELLDSNGKIKSEIIALFGWEKHINEINNSDLVCAYVGAINHLAMSNLDGLIEENLTRYTAVCNYVNPNYRSWIKEVMGSLNLPVDLRHENKADSLSFRDILDYPLKHPAVGVGIGLGVTGVLLAGLAIGGMLFFSRNSSAGGQLNLPTHNPLDSPGLR